MARAMARTISRRELFATAAAGLVAPSALNRCTASHDAAVTVQRDYRTRQTSISDLPTPRDLRPGRRSQAERAINPRVTTVEAGTAPRISGSSGGRLVRRRRRSPMAG
jgi:hypothetical protein